MSRPKALVWTHDRVAKFARTGQRPSPVMVWTPVQTGEFLDAIGDHDLYAMFHLIAFRGLRRGEACGLRWEDIDLRERTLCVAVQLTKSDGELFESVPKSDAGHRMVALDAATVSVLKAHRRRQAEVRLALGATWTDTGRVFTQADGRWIHPSWVSDLFDRLAAHSGLPPIRLHDLRHGAATLALAAGVDMKVIQEMLGHSSITLTSDTYTSVLPEGGRAAAEAAVLLVPRQRTPGLTSPITSRTAGARMPATPANAQLRHL
jgi:integrase